MYPLIMVLKSTHFRCDYYQRSFFPTPHKKMRNNYMNTKSTQYAWSPNRTIQCSIQTISTTLRYTYLYLTYVS